MKLEINDKDLKQGLFGLVLAIVEVIRDTLRIQALKRMEGGQLTEDEINRLGVTLMELDKAIEHLKEEQGVEEAVRSVREGLDDLVDSMVQGLTDPCGIARSCQTNKEIQNPVQDLGAKNDDR